MYIYICANKDLIIIIIGPNASIKKMKTGCMVFTSQ